MPASLLILHLKQEEFRLDQDKSVCSQTVDKQSTVHVKLESTQENQKEYMFKENAKKKQNKSTSHQKLLLSLGYLKVSFSF